MDEPNSERAHTERAVRVGDHVARIVSALNPTDHDDSSDVVDRFARRVLTDQWERLSRAVRDPAPAVIDIARPAISELVLLRYLCQLLRHDANALVAARAHIGVDAHAAGPSATTPDPDDRGPVDDERPTREVLADLGHRLGWALGRTRRLGREALPSGRWLAAAVGELHLYDELNAGRATSSGTSESASQLAWGSVLLCRTASAVQQLVRSSAPLPAARALTDLITECAAALPTTTASPRPLAG